MTQTLGTGEATPRLDMATLCELQQILTVMIDRALMAQERLRSLDADEAELAEVRHDLQVVYQYGWRLRVTLLALYIPEPAQ